MSKKPENGKSTMISVVIPVFNEVESIAALHDEIIAVFSELDYEYEVIIVDDGSTDGTASLVKQLKNVVYVGLRRNFGQTAALDAGIKSSQGELIVTLDGDGQNDPADIPAMIRYMNENGLDVVSGWRKDRKDGLSKHFSSRMANIFRRLLLDDGLNDSGCTLKVYRAECFEGITLMGEMHRFIPALLKMKGFRVGEMVVNHRPRKAGTTKYGWKRGIKGIIDIVNLWIWQNFSSRPFHIFGTCGIISFLLGLIIAVIGIYFHITGNILFRFFLPVLSSFLLISGLQLFLFGFISDVLAKTYFGTGGNASYSVRETVRTSEE